MATVFKTIETQTGVVYDCFYPLQPKQLEASMCSAKYRLYGGAKGGGKSYWLRSEGVKQAMSCPGIRGLILRRTYSEIYENTVIPLMKELPQELYKWNEKKQTMTFMNGSTIKFSYCKNMKDVLQYQGIEYDFIGIEELTHWSFEEWKSLMGSLRTTKSNVITNFFATTNPGGIGHQWVKRLWIDRNFQEGEYPEEYGFIQAYVYDNRVLMEMDPNYVRNLESLPELLRRAFLYGDWDVFEGQYFNEFNRDLHVISPYIPPRNEVKKIVVSFDYGFTSPSAIYWTAQLTDGRIITYREVYETQLTYKKLALRIKALTTQEEKIDRIVGDPAVINKKNEITESTCKEEFNSVGLKVFPANNNRLSGWLKLREGMQAFENPNTKQIDSAWKITSNCSNLIRTLPIQLHDKRNVEDLDTKLEDHAPDGVRYGMMEFRIEKNSFASITKLNKMFEVKQNNSSTKSSEFWKKKDNSKSSILTTNF